MKLRRYLDEGDELGAVLLGELGVGHVRLVPVDLDAVDERAELGRDGRRVARRQLVSGRHGQRQHAPRPARGVSQRLQRPCSLSISQSFSFCLS